jgi:FlaA1/EpsC-like NDP-sugar epimerase
MIQNKLLNNDNTIFEDSVILITGAGGTIGSQLVRKIEAKTIIAVDINEYSLYKLQRSIKDKNIHFIVGDVSDYKIVNMIFKKYKIDYVFNAAAYKHVDTLENENNSYSVIKNNILSTINLCKKAKKIKSMIHISSDKAVNPINNMGYTKLWCERIVQHYSKKYKNKFKIVRFGNIYNSSGSFVETMNWQLQNNLPITITDIKMKRHFMTVEDASSLILSIVDFEQTDSTYILDMGEEIDIIDLIPENYPYVIVGLRPGEKIKEQLVYEYEKLENTEIELIKRVKWKNIDMSDNLKKIKNELNGKKICLKKLKKIITTTTIL